VPGYSSDEVQAAIDKFLLGTVAMPQTTLGSREVLSARDDIYALLTATLLLRPDSYFYLILLARNRLEGLRRMQLAALDFLVAADTAAALQRRGKPVTNTTELTNAQAALLNMNAAINAGTGNRTRALGPEVDRFRRSVERFINAALAPNVVESGQVNETAGELRVTIRELWAEVVLRHGAMLTLITAIREAVANLNSAHLPQKAVEGAVSRMETRIGELTTELEADTDVSMHREAMLEFLTMRTLLTRIAAFRSPQLFLAPLASDGAFLTGTGAAVPASITGTISGPFNVLPGAVLNFQSGIPVVPSSLTLGSYSNAEVPTAELTYPIAFPLGAELRLRVDGVLYPAQSYSAVGFATQLLFLTSLQGYLTANLIPATAYSSGAQIYIRSDSADDVSSVEVLATTAGQLSFLQVTNFKRVGVCTPVPAAVIIAAGTPFPGVRLQDQATEYGNATGTTAAAAVLDLAVVSGLLNTTGGGRTFTATINLESAGVRPRMAVKIGLQVVAVVSVLGAQLTVSADIVFPNIGAVAYRIGTDFTAVPVGTRVQVSSVAVPLNSGPYRLVSGTVAEITVDRPFAAVADPVAVFVSSSFLKAIAPGTTPADGITAFPASGGATAVGYAVTVTQVRAVLTTFTGTGVNYLERGVQAGDQLTVYTTPVSAAVTVATVTMGTLTTTTGVPFFTGPLTYRIESVRYQSWETLVTVVSTFQDADVFAAADFAITRLLSGATATTLLATGPVGVYRDTVVDLGDEQAYVVPFERGIDNILRMLVEQGLDRAADLLTSLQVVEFFGMHPDGVSYATNLVRTAADVTREVAPQSRFAKSLWVHPQVRLLSNRRVSG